jgi:hypothetical protein
MRRPGTGIWGSENREAGPALVGVLKGETGSFALGSCFSGARQEASQTPLSELRTASKMLMSFRTGMIR